MAAREIIRFLKNVKVTYSVYDATAVGAREFHRQLQAPKARAINPKCTIEQMHTKMGSKAMLSLEFIDGTKETMDVSEKSVLDIFEDIEYYCSQIETQYEMEGKIID